MELHELIDHLRQQLLTAQGARLGRDASFRWEKAELEIRVVAKKDAKGGVSLAVVESGGSIGTEQAHTIKLTLTPVEAEPDRGLPRVKSRVRVLGKSVVYTGAQLSQESEPEKVTFGKPFMKKKSFSEAVVKRAIEQVMKEDASTLEIKKKVQQKEL